MTTGQEHILGDDCWCSPRIEVVEARKASKWQSLVTWDEFKLGVALGLGIASLVSVIALAVVFRIGF